MLQFITNFQEVPNFFATERVLADRVVPRTWALILVARVQSQLYSVGYHKSESSQFQ